MYVLASPHYDEPIPPVESETIVATILMSPEEQISNAAEAILRLSYAEDRSFWQRQETCLAVRALIRMIERKSSGGLEPIEVGEAERSSRDAGVRIAED